MFFSLALSLSSVALAQSGFDAHGFVPSAQDGDVRDNITLQRPGRMVPGEWYATGMFEVASTPLVLATEDELGALTREAALDNLAAVDLSAGFAFHERARVDLAAPLYLTSTRLGEPQGSMPGDVRLSAMFSLLRPAPEGTRFTGGVGFTPWVTVPTGRPDAFLGQIGPTAGGTLSGTVEISRWTGTAEAGARFQRQINELNITGSDELTFGVGATFLATADTSLGVEAHLRVPTQVNAFALRATPGEALFSIRRRYSDGLHLLGGAGTAITPGVGAAAWRLFLGAGFGKLEREQLDADGDGLTTTDQCPELPETVNGWLDEDGCPDELASLIVLARYRGTDYPEADIELSSGTDQRRYGFGPVRLTGRLPGEDWHAEAVQACMLAWGDVVLKEGDNRLIMELQPQLNATVRFRVEDEEGQPIEGATIAWVAGPTGCAPEEILNLKFGVGQAEVGAGSHEVAGHAEGYETRLVSFRTTPDSDQEIRIQLANTRVSLEKEQIRILEKVHFQTNSHVIKPLSYQLLSEVAALIVSRPELGRVEVGGHADERGSAQYNLELSQRRAEAVRTYLIKEGVAPDRLEAKGYGEERPLLDESTQKAWSLNRRVQFTILRQESEASP